MASSSHLKPGEKGRIKAVVDIEGKSGALSRFIQVYSNDPKNPVISLAVKLKVKDDSSSR